MKKIIFVYILLNVSLLAFPQAIHIFHDGKKMPDVVANAGIDSIYVAPKFLGSTEFQQVFATKDGEKRYDVVDSVKFNLPHLVMQYHTINVPFDYGAIKVVSSCEGEESPVLIFPDGSTKFPYHYREDEGIYMYGWDCREHNNNGSGVSDIRSETWYIVSGEMRDSIIVNFTGIPFAKNPYTEVCFSNEENEYTLNTNFPDSKVDVVPWENEGALEDFGCYYNEKGKPVIHFSRNESGERRHVNLLLSIGSSFVYEGAYWMEQLGKPFKHTSEEHMAALREFCDATEFENWGKNMNWWSDEPLWKWDGLNGDINGYFYHINDHVVDINIGDKGIHGTLPASFEVFMDDAEEMNLSHNALYGKIPYNIRHHKNWSKFGWDFIRQDPWYGGGFDMEDINLRMENEEVMCVDGAKSTAYEELAKHKLTMVSVGGPSEGICNLCLAYANKGFEYIYAAQGWLGGTQEEAQKAADEYDNVPNVKVFWNSWANGSLGSGLGALGSTFLLDSEGNVIDYAPMDFGLGDDLYANRLGKNLLKYLGEPEEHEPYVPKPIYTSTDYSHDGEVLTLQKATVGKGIDLVFMGDMYVDTLLVKGGQYEQDMLAAMESFFNIEPYKTFRERFNVYAVKAVSPQSDEGSIHKFNNDEIVFEYASKVPGVDLDKTPITVTQNTQSLFSAEGGECHWYGDASISYVYTRAPSEIICHETGGHGLAKLIDEYISEGMNNNRSDNNENFRNWIKAEYHDKGWGVNVSATDNPEEVPWSHFLNDERYKDEIGIYKGAWAYPEELWRPSEKSVMSDAFYLWFNAPSREAIYKKVMQLSEGDDWTYDYETFVEFDTPIREAHTESLAKVRYAEGEVQEVQKHRIELRPPTIYKGSWRDAGKCEKVTFDKEKFVQPNTSKRKAEKTIGNGSRMKGETQQQKQRPYILYKGVRYEADEFDKNMLNVK